MEYRDEVNQSEEKLLKVLGPLSNFAQFIKKIKHPDLFIELSKIIEIGAPEKIQLYNIESVLHKKVSQVCRAGSRFSKNCLCVALYGDTDNVMRWAVQHGALAVVTNKEIPGIPCIVVENPEQFYATVCGYFRSKSNIQITAVAGSIGKTTTKRMITSVFQEQFNTFNDPENENQMDCVGYICQHIPFGTEKQVQEVSEDTPGCMKYMSAMLRPNIVVITAVDKSHIEQFGSQDKIYEEVCSITNNMVDDGTVIIDFDDQEVVKYLHGNKKVMTISIDNPNASFYADNIRSDTQGLHFTIVDNINSKTFSSSLHNVFAPHNIIAALYAFAAGVISGERYDNILRGLDNYRTLGIRQNVYDGEDGVKLYVDCYNAVGKSVESAIIAASSINVCGKKIAVIGDVEEAGVESEEIHKEIIRIVSNSTFEYLLTFGPKMKEAVDSTPISSNLKVSSYLNKKDLARELRKISKPNDLVLFKASRKSALETVIEYLWPKSYRKEMRLYSTAKLKWRLKVIFS